MERKLEKSLRRYVIILNDMSFSEAIDDANLPSPYYNPQPWPPNKQKYYAN